MAESGYCPAGAEHDPNAPWNQKDPIPVEVEVCISITLSKTVRVKLDDYTIEEDQDEDNASTPRYDFSECNLKDAVQQQVVLPSDKFPDWDIDDFEVIQG